MQLACRLHSANEQLPTAKPSGSGCGRPMGPSQASPAGQQKTHIRTAQWPLADKGTCSAKRSAAGPVAAAAVQRCLSLPTRARALLHRTPSHLSYHPNSLDLLPRSQPVSSASAPVSINRSLDRSSDARGSGHGTRNCMFQAPCE
jgi:hypothetical protein